MQENKPQCAPENTTETLLYLYQLLRDHFGYLDWWPGETPFEIAVGAILTQNTAWTNVEKALDNLKAADVLDPLKLWAMEPEALAELIQPSGYFRVKERRLRAFLRLIVEDFDGVVERLFALPAERLREELLAVNGIGPETADSMILYGSGQPVFVIDAYTRRIFGRLGLTPPDASYQFLQDYFTANLPADMDLYNDYHAQIVYLGKDFCKPRPRCADCPLQTECRVGRRNLTDRTDGSEQQEKEKE